MDKLKEYSFCILPILRVLYWPTSHCYTVILHSCTFIDLPSVIKYCFNTYLITVILEVYQFLVTYDRLEIHSLYNLTLSLNSYALLYFPTLLFYTSKSSTVLLLYCYIVILVYCYTVLLLSCYTVMLLYCHTVILLNCYTAFLFLLTALN